MGLPRRPPRPTRHAPRSPRPAAALVAAAAALWLAAGPVLAHAELVSSDPAADAVLATPPAAVTLVFDDELTSKSSFLLVGPSGTVGTGRADPADDHALTLATPDLPPGTYQVRWTAQASDGDITRDTFTFTVSEPTPSRSAAPVASASAAPSSPAPSTSAAPSPSPSTSPAPDAPTAASGDVILPIAVALLLVAAVGVFVLRRSRQA